MSPNAFLSRKVSLGASTGTTRVFIQSFAYLIISAIMICCGLEQWTSRDKMSGYGDEKKAYLAMAITASSNRTREVSVCPCCVRRQ